jgi:hypothetical protein
LSCGILSPIKNFLAAAVHYNRTGAPPKAGIDRGIQALFLHCDCYLHDYFPFTGHDVSRFLFGITYARQGPSARRMAPPQLGHCISKQGTPRVWGIL